LTRQQRIGAAGRRAILALIVCSFSLAAAPTANAADRLPDLGMAHPSEIQIDKSSGRRLLRYTTVIANVGRGAFELHGTRPSTSASQMSVSQRIFNDAGGYRDVPTTATMFFAGDGHNHWHVRDLESQDLIRLDNGSKVGTAAKHGFCFFDNVRYRLTLTGAPQSARYAGCGTSTSLAVTMGLSVGWGDAYHYYLAYQYIDITGVSSGRYRLKIAADAANWFAESNNSNNSSWADLQLKSSGQPRIIRYGPSI